MTAASGVAVLTAVTSPAWEARLIAELERAPGGLRVARRCVDVADLLAAAAAGQGQAALVSADLRGLDRDVLGRLAAAGVATVGVVAPADEDAERRLRQLGVGRVVTTSASAAEVADAVLAAAAERLDRPWGALEAGGSVADVGTWTTDGTGADDPRTGGDDAGFGRGQLIAVWGPTGAPGRTTVAVNLAAEIARLGRATLLADADTYGGAVAQVLGMLDEAPGLVGAARAANTGVLDLPALARHARQVAPRLRVLTGITRTERWPELRPASLEVVWSLARGLAEYTIADCGFCLELDEELSYDTAAPRRNGATVTTLQDADVVLAVGSADPVGLQRLVRGLAELAEAAPGADVRVVVNRLRASVVGGQPERQVRDALARYAGLRTVRFVPEDRPALDAALSAGRFLAEVAPTSPARTAIVALARNLTGAAESARRRRRTVPA